MCNFSAAASDWPDRLYLKIPQGRDDSLYLTEVFQKISTPSRYPLAAIKL